MHFRNTAGMGYKSLLLVLKLLNHVIETPLRWCSDIFRVNVAENNFLSIIPSFLNIQDYKPGSLRIYRVQHGTKLMEVSYLQNFEKKTKSKACLPASVFLCILYCSLLPFLSFQKGWQKGFGYF